MRKAKEAMNTPSAAEIAIGNIGSLFECSVLISQQKMKPEEAVVIFDAFCDENISLELNGKRYRYDWLLFSARQNWAKQSTFENLLTEVLDRITFHYTYDFYFHDDEDEDYLQAVSQPPSYKIHCMATVNPKNSKVIKIKVMTGEAAMHLVHFNRNILEQLDASNNITDINNNVKQTTTINTKKKKKYNSSTATTLLLVNNDQNTLYSSTVTTTSSNVSPKPSSNLNKKGHRRIVSYTHDGRHSHRNNQHHRPNPITSLQDRLHSRTIHWLTTCNNNNKE
jgi:hypothetical protein